MRHDLSRNSILLTLCASAIAAAALGGCLVTRTITYEPVRTIAVIPQPKLVEPAAGAFPLDAGTRIVVDANAAPAYRRAGDDLAERLARATGREVEVAVQPAGASPRVNAVTITSTNAPATTHEGYALLVEPDRVVIRARGAAGAFYAVQTLRQLLPPAFETPGERAATVEFRVPCVRIVDEPRFAWRGMHFDVGRHFFDKTFLERYLDYLAMHKINVFHWHLTEDQGWRIDIERYPKLAAIAAWRHGTWKHTTADTAEDPTRYGGYFTHEEIREIVAYARDRFITVVPEIEMPGHSQAALAAYPELSCTGGPHEVWTRWGVSPEVYCAGNDEVFTFLEGVLDEVFDLFPGEFVHIGGDEVPKDRWKACPKCQARIRAEGLADENELQSWFIRRIETFVNARGRRIIGWDEILEGGLAPNAAVMSWRGTSGGIEAARSGHFVVMTPNGQTYFNYMQTREKKGPGHEAYLPLTKVYALEPTAGLTPDEAKWVLGAQACLWTEYVPTPADAEYLLFPRLCAIAEVAWSPPELRDEAVFLERVEDQLVRLRAMGVNACDVIEDESR